MLGQTFTIPGQALGHQGTRLCHLLSDESLLRRLSGNTGEDCVSALRALHLPDRFWTDEFKVVPCAKTYSHKWTLCPCAHIGETARRRCPRTVNYKAVLCPLVKAKKTCPLGDSCTYAHNVFEHWLHPSRYKTRLCSFGRNCNRSICFFAHSADELRCVPCSDDKEGDEREYLMQIIMAQESGLLPPSTVEQMPQAPVPPLMSNIAPDLSAVLQQALQQPLPPSNHPSVSGLPDAASIITGRNSMSGVPDLMAAPVRPSLSGHPDAGAAAILRASMSGVPDAVAAGMMALPGRPSLSGPPDRTAALMQPPPPRSSLSGLHHEGMMRQGRPSGNGIHDPSAILLSMSVQNGMQRAMSNDLGVNVNAAISAAAAATSMQRAMSSELARPIHSAAAMQHAINTELAAAGGPRGNAAAAAAVAMERALSWELAASAGVGVGSSSPLRNAAAAAALERAFSHREAAAGAAAGVPGLESGCASTRSMGQSVRHDLNFTYGPAINSVESDSLIQIRGGGIGPTDGATSTCLPNGTTFGFEAMGDPQGPPRLSDPGTHFPLAVHPHMSACRVPTRGSDSGTKLQQQQQQQQAQQQQPYQQLYQQPYQQARQAHLSMFPGNELNGLESLIPLVNNALAAGTLSLNIPSMRRSNSSSNSGSNNGSNSGSNSGIGSGRVLSPPLQELNVGSPQSGPITPRSTNSVADGAAAVDSGPLLKQQHPQLGGSPLGNGSVPESAAYDSMLRAATAASNGNAGVAASNGKGSAAADMGGAAADQAYLAGLVARLQDQGVNKEQLVSSLSQLLASLLSVSS